MSVYFIPMSEGVLKGNHGLCFELKIRKIALFFIC